MSAVGRGTTARETEHRAQKPLPGELRDLPPAEILASLDEGVCPWCDDPRTFVWVSQHLVRGHGFDLAELRDYLVVPKRRSFISGGLSDWMSRKAKRLDTRGNMARGKKPGKHHLGASALAHNRQMAIDNREKNILILRAAQAAMTPEQRRANALKATQASMAAMTFEDYQRAGLKGGAIRGKQLASRSHCINGHEFTPENIRLRSNGTRLCRTCARVWNRKAKAKARA
jgi:hypothetical protein